MPVCLGLIWHVSTVSSFPSPYSVNSFIVVSSSRPSFSGQWVLVSSSNNDNNRHWMFTRCQYFARQGIPHCRDKQEPKQGCGSLTPHLDWLHFWWEAMGREDVSDLNKTASPKKNSNWKRLRHHSLTCLKSSLPNYPVQWGNSWGILYQKWKD